MSRITPLERPWPDFFEKAMARTMPPGMEPLSLFKTVATSERAWAKFSAGALLDPGPLSLRHREIVIGRTTARCGCDYEWGIHVVLFAGRAGLSNEQVQATTREQPDEVVWTESEQALIATIDALLDRKKLDEAEFSRLRIYFDQDQILELVQLVAFYHGVSLICGAFALMPEPGMPTLPPKGV